MLDSPDAQYEHPTTRPAPRSWGNTPGPRGRNARCDPCYTPTEAAPMNRSSKCGHRTGSGRKCNNPVNGAASCAAGHPAAPNPVPADDVVYYTMAINADPFAADQAPPAVSADVTRLASQLGAVVAQQPGVGTEGENEMFDLAEAMYVELDDGAPSLSDESLERPILEHLNGAIGAAGRGDANTLREHVTALAVHAIARDNAMYSHFFDDRTTHASAQAIKTHVNDIMGLELTQAQTFNAVTNEQMWRRAFEQTPPVLVSHRYGPGRGFGRRHDAAVTT